MTTHIFNILPDDLSEEVFEDLIKTKHLKIERIISKGQTSPEDFWYDQQQNEWLIVLKGSAIIAFENQENVTLKQGDYLNIKAHQKHRVHWTKPDTETIWLAIHY